MMSQRILVVQGATQTDKHTTAITPSMMAMTISPALPMARVAG